MTKKEKLNRQIWEILQDIEVDYEVGETGKAIEYEFPHFQGVGIIPKKRRKDIYYKLQEWRAIKILNESITGGVPLLKYRVLQPKFRETYKKFQKACDINSYLNDFQQKAFKGKKLPKFSQVKQEKTKIDKWLESKDDWTLRKIWQVVSALNAEWQLRDEDVFAIPHDKFERARITNSKDLEVVLEILHKHAVIKVSKMIGSSTPIHPKSGRTLWDIEVEKIKELEKATTQIRIYPKLFTYLRDTLLKKIPREPEKNDKTTSRKRRLNKSDKNQEKHSNIPSYNQAAHKILFMDKEIDIPSNTNQDSLCKVIFEDRGSLRKEWNCDEIVEKWGDSPKKTDWRKVYNAAREVNTKVAIETGEKDLFIVRTLTTTLNPKYLK